jgi:hypothetical protein
VAFLGGTSFTNKVTNNYYNYSRTLCIECISYSDLIKFHYFADTIERGDRGVKAEEIGVKKRVTFRRTLM